MQKYWTLTEVETQIQKEDTLPGILLEIRLQNILYIKVDVAEILVGSSICGSKKFDESVSTKLFTCSQFSYFNKSI